MTYLCLSTDNGIVQPHMLEANYLRTKGKETELTSVNDDKYETHFFISRQSLTQPIVSTYVPSSSSSSKTNSGTDPFEYCRSPCRVSMAANRDDAGRIILVVLVGIVRRPVLVASLRATVLEHRSAIIFYCCRRKNGRPWIASYL